jgi:protein-tyrosine kinase
MSLIERALQKMNEKAQPNVARRDAPPRRETLTPLAQPLGDATSRRVLINRTALQSEGLVPPEHQARQIMQQFRQIKRPLIANAMRPANGQGAQATQIMVASALPGEGKTFTALNLALCLAQEKDLQVVLVDADVLKPQLSRVFGIELEVGLLDALRDNSLDPASIVRHTDVPNLAVVSAGHRTENTTELLASSRMEQVAQALGSVRDRRIVVFDTSPLLLTTESQALANVAGQVVLVVRAESTPQQTVMDAVTHLPNRGAVSLVLNQCIAESQPASYYQQGEGQGPAAADGT